MTSLVMESAGLSARLVAWASLLVLQSTFLISLGLAACAFLRRRSAALRSSILRATLLAVIVCPVLGSFGGLFKVDLPMPRAVPVVSELAVASASSSLSVAPATASPLIRFRAPRAITTTPPAAPPAARAGLPTLYVALSLAWIGGTTFLLVRFARRCLYARRLQRRAVTAPQPVVAACRMMARRMHVPCPRIGVHTEIGSPLLVGILRSTILLPEAFPNAANGQVFAHELAHRRRHDCLWNALGTVTTALCFFQPLMWKLTRYAEQTNEEVCDDFVLSYTGQAHTYARRLVEMAETLGCRSSATLGLGVVHFSSSLGRRVQRLLSFDTARAVRTGRAEMLLVILIGAAAIGFVSRLGIRSAARAQAATFGSRDDVSEPDLKPLIEALAGDDWRRREQAAISIAQQTGARTAAIPALIRALSDEEWRVRKASAVALTTMGPATTDAVFALITALGDVEWHVRRPAAEALAVLGPVAQPAVPALGTALSDDEWQVRRAAAAALAGIGPASKPATSGLIRTLNDEQWHVREAAAMALGAIGPDAAAAIPVLIKRLDDPEWRVRRATAGALEEIAVGDKTAIPEVIGALRDSEWQQRQAAAQALERLLRK